jgi:hypothetical protein
MYDHFYRDLATSRSALFLDGWIKFNEEKWVYKAERVLFQLPGKELPKLEGVFYLDKKGHVVMPPRNPYLPLQFTPTRQSSHIGFILNGLEYQNCWLRI